MAGHVTHVTEHRLYNQHHPSANTSVLGYSTDDYGGPSRLGTYRVHHGQTSHHRGTSRTAPAVHTHPTSHHTTGFPGYTCHGPNHSLYSVNNAAHGHHVVAHNNHFGAHHIHQDNARMLDYHHHGYQGFHHGNSHHRSIPCQHHHNNHGNHGHNHHGNHTHGHHQHGSVHHHHNNHSHGHVHSHDHHSGRFHGNHTHVDGCYGNCQHHHDNYDCTHSSCSSISHCGCHHGGHTSGGNRCYHDCHHCHDKPPTPPIPMLPPAPKPERRPPALKSPKTPAPKPERRPPASKPQKTPVPKRECPLCMTGEHTGSHSCVDCHTLALSLTEVTVPDVEGVPKVTLKKPTVKVIKTKRAKTRGEVKEVMQGPFEHFMEDHADSKY